MPNILIVLIVLLVVVAGIALVSQLSIYTKESGVEVPTTILPQQIPNTVLSLIIKDRRIVAFFTNNEETAEKYATDNDAMCNTISIPQSGFGMEFTDHGPRKKLEGRILW